MIHERLFHFALAIPALIGLMLMVSIFAMAGRIADVETRPAADAVAAWSEILPGVFETLPAPEDLYPDDDAEYPEEEHNRNLTSAQQQGFARNNAFLVSCALLMVLFLPGFSLVESALENTDETWMPWLRNGGLFGFMMLYYIAIGFDLNFPGDFNGFFPFPSSLSLITMGGDEGMAFNYADGGYTIWTDVLYIAMYAALVTLIVASITSGIVGKFFGTVLALVAGFLFPIISSWVWGGGWLDQMMGVYDFSGGVQVHVVAGIAALVGLVTARLGRLMRNEVVATAPSEVLPGSRLRKGGLWRVVLGMLCLLAGIVGTQAGSVLSAEPLPVAFVLQSTGAAVAAGALAAGLMSLFSKRRARLLFVLAGMLAGWAALSVGADVVETGTAAMIGLSAGVLAGTALLLMDMAQVSDPLGAVAASLLGGAWGAVAAMPYIPLDYGVTPFGQVLLILVSALAIGFFTIPVAIFLALLGALIPGRSSEGGL